MNKFLVLTLLALPEATGAADAQKPVKVFILAGQSNMEGKAKVSLLDYQASQPATRDLFKHLRAVFKKGWRQHLEEWNKVGSDYPYHYLGSAKTMVRIGRAFAEAVLELRGEQRRGG